MYPPPLVGKLITKPTLWIYPPRLLGKLIPIPTLWIYPPCLLGEVDANTHRMDILGRGDVWDNMATNTPIGRNGTDDEVGDFCAYLCTEAASWIHGQSINQNGGTVMEH